MDFVQQGPAIEIAQLQLLIDGQTHYQRKLTWHSNNMMERINLPTLFQGGVEYHNKIILFRKRLSNYELVVVDLDSEEAASWKKAAKLCGTTFKVGKNSTRRCGFF